MAKAKGDAGRQSDGCRGFLLLIGEAWAEFLVPGFSSSALEKTVVKQELTFGFLSFILSFSPPF